MALVLASWTLPWGLTRVPEHPKFHLLDRGQCLILLLGIITIGNLVCIKFCLGEYTLGSGTIATTLPTSTVARGLSALPRMDSGDLASPQGVGRGYLTVVVNVGILHRLKGLVVGLVSHYGGLDDF